MNVDTFRKVSLYPLEQLAIIILEKSGVVYSNQAGGIYCLQPEAEGMLILLMADYSIVEHKASLLWERLSGVFDSVSSYMTDKQADEVDDLLSLYIATKDMSVDRAQLKDSYEAWVHVNIEGNLGGMIEGFGNFKAILIWPNSD